MGEVINLRLARKDRKKRQRAEQAQENRLAFGRKQSERDLTAAAGRLERSRLDAHRLASGEAPQDDGVA